jgi:hypothetical protein
MITADVPHLAFPMETEKCDPISIMKTHAHPAIRLAVVAPGPETVLSIWIRIVPGRFPA